MKQSEANGFLKRQYEPETKRATKNWNIVSIMICVIIN